jgi:hypothetical protein
MAKIEKLDGYDPVAEGEQDERGVDLIGIRHNLALTPLERLERHNRAAASILWLRDVLKPTRLTPTRPSA